MAETTSSEVTELINAKATDTLLIHYQYDEVVALSYARYKDMQNEPSAVARFPRRAKNAHTDVSTEATSLTPVAWNPTSADITIDRVGIAREPSETVFEDTVLGRAALMSELVVDSARLIGIAREEDFWGHATSITAHVNNAGAAFTIANGISLVALMRTGKVRGPLVMLLGDNQGKNLQNQQASATATPWQTFYQPNADGSNFLGYFMGAPVWASGLRATVNTGANEVGLMFADGQSAPDYCALGYAVKRQARLKTDELILKDTHLTAMFQRAGSGLIADNFAAKVTSSATA